MKSKAKFISHQIGIVNTSLVVALVMCSYSKIATAQEGAVPNQPFASSSTSVIVERYPSGSIQSTKTADQALADVRQQRSDVETRFADEERKCYEKFFATTCVDKIKEVRRRALIELQQVEIEANAFNRRARVAERDKALADKRPQVAPIVKPANAPENNEESLQKSGASSAQHGTQPSRKPVDAPTRTGQEAAGPDRVEKHNARLERLKAEEAAGAQKRADNVAAFEKKARDAEERQREVAARKAQKERERAEKTPPAIPAPN